MSRYLLAPHVHLCVTGDHGVLLDLRRDQYVGVSRAQMRALHDAIRGWPAPPPGISAAPGAPDAAESLLRRMLADGMLTSDERCGKPASLLSIPYPRSTLSEPDPHAPGDLFTTRPPLTTRHVINFILACLSARLTLRLRPIAAVVAAAAARKARRAGHVDLAATRAHIQAYAYLRPLLFTRHDACLFDALALGKFLARYGIYATWVFGVQTGPFAAHCWLQHEDIVLNDTPDNVRRYAPILSI